MLFYHRSGGSPLEITVRSAREQDAPQIISCIRDAYGETYVKPALYSEGEIVLHSRTGTLRFSVAETGGGRLAGVTACGLPEHFPGMAEIACQAVRREFGGYGLALPLALHAAERAAALPLTARFARALGCHAVSQKTLRRMGFTACGLLLNVFDRRRLACRLQGGEGPKIPQMVAVRRQKKSDAGALWLPKELVPLAERMYRELGVSWRLRTGSRPLSGSGTWDREEDARHAALTLWARSCGASFEERLTAELKAAAGLPEQTVNLYLNLSCPDSGAAYETAREAGFFFTGFLPCAQDGEYMILHHPLRVATAAEGIPHIPEYVPFLAQIRRSIHET